MFTPSVGQDLLVGSRFVFAEHPSAPGMPYGQEGRQAVVYLLEGEDGSRHALKVFKPRYRVPSLVSLSEALRDFASLPGLRVADRLVLSSLKHAALLAQSADLTYAALMLWIDGPTWMQVLLDKRDLTRQESLEIARAFASLLVRLEEKGIAHCDLSASNVMLPALAGAEHAPASEIELVDVEQLYAPNLPKSQFVSSGSPGYAHPHVPSGLWGPAADRFAGAILLAEMLCWSERQVRDAAWGESYFDPSELQADSSRYRLLEQALRTLGGQQAAALVQRAWQADTLESCPTFGEWLVALPATPSEIELEGATEIAHEDTRASVAMAKSALRTEPLPELAVVLKGWRGARSLADATETVDQANNQTADSVASAELDRPVNSEMQSEARPWQSDEAERVAATAYRDSKDWTRRRSHSRHIPAWERLFLYGAIAIFATVVCLAIAFALRPTRTAQRPVTRTTSPTTATTTPATTTTTRPTATLVPPTATTSPASSGCSQWEAEDNNSAARADSLDGGCRRGSISTVGDSDWYHFTVNVARPVVIWTTTDGDTEISLYDSTATLLGGNDDGTGTLGSQFERSLAPGKYFVRVFEHGNDRTIYSYIVNVTQRTPSSSTANPPSNPPADAASLLVALVIALVVYLITGVWVLQ